MYVYIIRCEDHSYYTGVAADIMHRLREHYLRLPGCAKYTRSHKMTEPVAIWSAAEKNDAYRLEYRIKRLSRKEKEKLIGSPHRPDLFFRDLDCVGFSPFGPEELRRISQALICMSDT